LALQAVFEIRGRVALLGGEQNERGDFILTALITCLAVGSAAAQSCDSKAVSADGKPLHGAAKMSFVRKCKRDACGSKAVSADGKPLHGAAKNSFMAKCMRSA
jgi:hypothetical protein